MSIHLPVVRLPLSAITTIDLVLRPLTPGDAATYRALRLRALTEFPDSFTSSAEEEAPRADDWTRKRLAPLDGHVMLGAFADDVLAGTAGLERRPRTKERHKALLFGMHVAPEHAGRRIGRKLVDALLAEARRWPGLEQVTLTVTRTNERARRLYLDAGFITFGIEHRAIKIGDTYFDKEHMVLFLD